MIGEKLAYISVSSDAGADKLEYLLLVYLLLAIHVNGVTGAARPQPVDTDSCGLECRNFPKFVIDGQRPTASGGLAAGTVVLDTYTNAIASGMHSFISFANVL